MKKMTSMEADRVKRLKAASKYGDRLMGDEMDFLTKMFMKDPWGYTKIENEVHDQVMVAMNPLYKANEELPGDPGSNIVDPEEIARWRPEHLHKIMVNVKSCATCGYQTNVVGDMGKHKKENHARPK